MCVCVAVAESVRSGSVAVVSGIYYSLPIRPAPTACRISTASPILLHPSLITVFRVVPTLVSHENDSQRTRVSSLAGMEVEPSTWYSSRATLPSTDPTHWRLTSQPCLCSNHHSTWAHMWGCMCSTGPFQYRWLMGNIYSSCHYHRQIGSIHLSHCYYMFPWLCAWDVCYIIFCHLLHIRSGKTGNLFSLLLWSLWWVQIFGYVLASRSYSFVCTVRHLIIIIVQTYLETLN